MINRQSVELSCLADGCGTYKENDQLGISGLYQCQQHLTRFHVCLPRMEVRKCVVDEFNRCLFSGRLTVAEEDNVVVSSTTDDFKSIESTSSKSVCARERARRRKRIEEKMRSTMARLQKTLNRSVVRPLRPFFYKSSTNKATEEGRYLPFPFRSGIVSALVARGVIESELRVSRMVESMIFRVYVAFHFEAAREQRKTQIGPNRRRNAKEQRYVEIVNTMVEHLSKDYHQRRVACDDNGPNRKPGSGFRTRIGKLLTYDLSNERYVQPLYVEPIYLQRRRQRQAACRE